MAILAVGTRSAKNVRQYSIATVCVVLGGKTVVEVIYICKSYLSYFCAFSEDLCYINFSLLNSPVIPVFIIADVPDWRGGSVCRTHCSH